MAGNYIISSLKRNLSGQAEKSNQLTLPHECQQQLGEELPRDRYAQEANPFPSEAGFNCKPCPAGAAPETAEPFGCLSASLLLSLLPPPSLLTIASNAFKLQNLLPLFCCSSTWITGAKKKAGNRARTKHRERAGVGGESRNSRSLHFSCSRAGLCLAAFTSRVERAGLTMLGETTPWAIGSENLGSNFVSGYCSFTKELSRFREICPQQRWPPLYLCDDIRSYPGTKFHFLDNMLQRGALLQMLQKLIERKNAHKWLVKKKGVIGNPHFHRNPNTSILKHRTSRAEKAL